jgi:CheY-like chemotaxis protein
MPRILVIDDEPLVRSTVVMILTRAGFSVEEASDGQAGIAMCHKNPPDVVITDIFMPNRDGIEVVMELNRSCPRTTFDFGEVATVRTRSKSVSMLSTMWPGRGWEQQTREGGGSEFILTFGATNRSEKKEAP